MLTQVDVDDGRGNHYVRSFHVEPTGNFDRAEREELGFAQVKTTRDDFSTVEQQFHNQDFYRRGLLTRTVEADKDGKLFQISDRRYDDPPTTLELRTGSFFPANREDGDDQRLRLARQENQQEPRL